MLFGKLFVEVLKLLDLTHQLLYLERSQYDEVSKSRQILQGIYTARTGSIAAVVDDETNVFLPEPVPVDQSLEIWSQEQAYDKVHMLTHDKQLVTLAQLRSP